MATEEKSNRSSAFTTEQLGEINVAMSLAIKDAVAGAVAAAMAGLAPILKEVALTPEKLREINKPYVDPAKQAREDRERDDWREEIAQQRAFVDATRANCSHLYRTGQEAIALVHNQLDRQVRGLCMLCHEWIFPREWTIDPPDEKNHKGLAKLRGPHKDYQRVVRIEQQRSMQ